jgi:hypothetical protein
MAVKICTTGGACITCSDRTASQVVTAIEEAAKKGGLFYCCGGGKLCVRIDQITTITEARKPDDDDDRGWGGRGIDLGHPDIVILTGGR